jgi:drug/metabolite transporter (DMT)-like permease
MLAGWLVFGETLSWGFSLAIALVIAGLALVNWPRSRRAASGAAGR